MNKPVVTFDLVPNGQSTFGGSMGSAKESLAASSLCPHPKSTLQPLSQKAPHTGFIRSISSWRGGIKGTRQLALLLIS